MIITEDLPANSEPLKCQNDDQLLEISETSIHTSILY